MGFSKGKPTIAEVLYEFLWDALKKLHFDVSKDCTKNEVFH